MKEGGKTILVALTVAKAAAIVAAIDAYPMSYAYDYKLKTATVNARKQLKKRLAQHYGLKRFDQVKRVLKGASI